MPCTADLPVQHANTDMLLNDQALSDLNKVCVVKLDTLFTPAFTHNAEFANNAQHLTLQAAHVQP